MARRDRGRRAEPSSTPSREVASGDGAGHRDPAAAARVSPDACWPAPGSAPSRTSCRASGSSPTRAPTRTSTRCAPALAERARGRRRVRRGRSTRIDPARSSRRRSPTTSPTSPPTSPRPAALPGRPGRRGAVVVAVLLPRPAGAPAAARALRALQSMLAHLRLDADEETVAGRRVRRPAPLTAQRPPRVHRRRPRRRSRRRRIGGRRRGSARLPAAADRQRSRGAPWAWSCRSTAAPPSPTPRASSGSPSASSTRKKAGHEVVVVVSAMGDTTDELLDLAQQVSPAAAGPRARHAADRRRADLDGAAGDGDRQPRATRPARSPAARPA